MAKVFIEESTLTGIGDAIREKEGSTGLVPVTEMASRISAISGGGDLSDIEPLNAELEQILYGTDTGGKSFYDEFWDCFQNYGNRTNYNYAFFGEGWRSANYNPKYPLKPHYANTMFASSWISDTKIPIDFSDLKVDYLSSLFQSSSLVTIRTLTVQKRHTYGSAFSGCSKLENITFEGEIGNDINFGSCTKLSEASIYSIRDHLSDTATGKVVTFSQTAITNANLDTANGVGIDGTFTSEKPNWTFALV